MSRYESERFVPATPSCVKSKLSLKFDGRKLYLNIHDYSNRVIEYTAVSGKPVKGGFDYSIQRQKQAFHGPIPSGEYWITLSELWKNAWYRPGSDNAWGDYRVAIHPYPTTKTYGRGGFFIHGGAIPGSAGCIDLTKNMNRFIKHLRTLMPGKKDCYIPLTVEY